ncbi:OB-fold protein [Puia sp.]|jgi:hypothetical protein|uniref:OB-fold protein n=1 Tax=Puia sp. TaxID=2045100 RepID=UPI002F3F4FB6
MERRTKYGISLLVFLIAGLSIYGLLTGLYRNSKTLLKADVHITAPGLASAFESNEHFADSLYLNKVLSVTGTVKQVVGAGTGRTIARLDGDDDTRTTIDCHLDSLYNLDTPPLHTGDSVTIRGTCAGRWANVVLLQCIVEK